MERQNKGPRDLEAYCSGGQGPPRAVAPTDDDDDDGIIKLECCLTVHLPHEII